MVSLFDQLKAEGILRDNVTAKIINNFINALMSYNILNCKDKTEFVTQTKDELNFLFNVIRK